MDMRSWKIGQRVIFNGDYGKGTIVFYDEYDSTYLVKFDEKSYGKAIDIHLDNGGRMLMEKVE